MSRRHFLLSLFVALFLISPPPCQTQAQAAPHTVAQARRITDLRPTVILISLDGFRYDYIQRPPAVNLRKLAARGVWAEQGMIPSFPSMTFPNHYTLVTGLYPGEHGIIHNTMWDPWYKTTFELKKRAEVESSRWWGGEPIWVTAVKQGQKSASMFWPGSEAEIAGYRPTYWHRFDDHLPNELRVREVLGWLDLPADQRPTIITMYFSDTDHAGHDFGPDSPQVNAAIAKVDGNIGALLAGLRARGIEEKVNIIVVADHGMIPTSRSRTVIADDYINPDSLNATNWTPVLTASPKDGNVQAAIEKLSKAPHLRVYRKEETPLEWRYRANRRVPEIVGLVDDGWVFSTRKWLADRPNADRAGAHGYNPRTPKMHAIFVATGPAFKRGMRIQPFENVNVYVAMCRILGLEPAKNSGDVRVLGAVMR